MIHKKKTISGHYDTVFDLAHNNRCFIPANCVKERLGRNYYLVMMGSEVPFDLPEMRFTNDMWKEYKRLVSAYWQDRSMAQKEEYEKLQRELRRLRQYRPYWLLSHGGLLGMTIGLLFLPLMIANDIAQTREFNQAIAAWETFKCDQFLRDLEFSAQKSALREALHNYDLQTGADMLRIMDSTVKDMAYLAGDLVNASDKLAFNSLEIPRFASIEGIYDKLYDPAFQSFQEKQRPSRRYNGSYLQFIRDQERKEINKKSQNKFTRSHKMKEAFEIVFSIGDKDTTGYDAAWVDAIKAESLLKDFCDHLLQQKNVCFVTTRELERPDWQPPFANGLLVINLCMHGDEATPGVHLTCVPYARNCKRGPAVQPSILRALTGMGYPSTWKEVLDENGNPIPKTDRDGNIIYNKDGSIRNKKEPDKQGIIDWIEDQKRWLHREMEERLGWEREYKGAHPRGNLSTYDYKVARAEECRQEIERQIDAMIVNFKQHIEDQIERLDETVDRAWQDKDEWNNIVRYLNTCSVEEYEALYKRARKHLDYLPENERHNLMMSLDNLIKNAQADTSSSAHSDETKAQDKER